MNQSDIIIYHNPACGTSRTVLAALGDAGFAPRVVEYLKTPPSEGELRSLIQRMGIAVRDLLRTNVEAYADLNLDNPQLRDDELIVAMMQNPILINRPIVVTPYAVKLCRPSETVQELIQQIQNSMQEVKTA